MTNTIFPVDATAGAPSYAGRMLRQVGSVAFMGATATRPFGARSGVSRGTSVTTVRATSTTWYVDPHGGELDFEAALESGPTPYAIDATVSGALRPADGFARVDLIWVRQDIPLEDGSAAPAAVPGYTYGTVAATAPALPARCSLLAWVNVPASGGGSPTVTWKASYVAAAGGVVPVRNAAELALLAPFASAENPVYADQLDTGALWRNVGSGWFAPSIMLPHLRARASVGGSRLGAQWNAVQIDAVGEFSGEQPWTLAGFTLTVASDGLYSMEATASMAVATFAVRLWNFSTSIVLAQTPIGTSVSFSNSVSMTRRLVAGTQIILQVYPTSTMNVAADAALSPSFLSITKLSA